MIKVKVPSHLPSLEQQMKGALGARDNKRRAGKVQVRQGFPLRNSPCLFHGDEDPFNFFLPPFSSPSFPLSPGG